MPVFVLQEGWQFPLKFKRLPPFELEWGGGNIEMGLREVGVGGGEASKLFVKARFVYICKFPEVVKKCCKAYENLCSLHFLSSFCIVAVAART